MKWRADVTLALSVALYAPPGNTTASERVSNGVWVLILSPGQLLFVLAPGARRAVPAHVADSFVADTLVDFDCLSARGVCVTLTWYVPQLSPLMPRCSRQWSIRIDKTDLDVLRFAHFWRWRPSPCASAEGLARVEVALAAALILCGQHSMEIFCLGVFWRSRAISYWPRSPAVSCCISLSAFPES